MRFSESITKTFPKELAIKTVFFTFVYGHLTLNKPLLLKAQHSGNKTVHEPQWPDLQNLHTHSQILTPALGFFPLLCGDFPPTSNDLSLLAFLSVIAYRLRNTFWQTHTFLPFSITQY
jgi:hypothetical protein